MKRQQNLIYKYFYVSLLYFNLSMSYRHEACRGGYQFLIKQSSQNIPLLRNDFAISLNNLTYVFQNFEIFHIPNSNSKYHSLPKLIFKALSKFLAVTF